MLQLIKLGSQATVGVGGEVMVEQGDGVAGGVVVGGDESRVVRDVDSSQR